MPDAVIRDAPQPDYAGAGGPALRDFVTGLDARRAVDVTAIGHSYGGAVVGVADREGLDVDRVLHIESAGAGRDVESVADYPRGRDVDRYTMQAPGDLIALSQGQQVGPVGHGADVNELDGFTRLETGRFSPEHPERPGEVIQGPSSHSDVLSFNSTAWQGMFGVVTGTQVVPRSDPVVESGFRREGPLMVPYRDTRSPYEDPDYPGLPPIPVP